MKVEAINCFISVSETERPSTMTPSILAIILNWNGFDDTVACIQSLKESTLQLSSILLLDQASPDDSGKKLEQLYQLDKQVMVILNDKNYGFSGGVNIGIRRALEMGADFVFLINNDTIVDKDCVSLLYDTIKDDLKVAVVGPSILYYSKPNIIWQAGGYFSKLKMGVIVPSKNMTLSALSQEVAQVSFLTGCALMIRKETFEQVGYLDTSYFFYMEDVDFSLRVTNSGLRMCYNPIAKVWHKIDDIAVDRTTPFVLFHIAKSNVIMLRKRFFGFLMLYGLILQLILYTPFRILQIIKGGSGFSSGLAWMNGLFHGLIEKV